MIKKVWRAVAAETAKLGAKIGREIGYRIVYYSDRILLILTGKSRYTLLGHGVT